MNLGLKFYLLMRLSALKNDSNPLAGIRTLVWQCTARGWWRISAMPRWGLAKLCVNAPTEIRTRVTALRRLDA